jgi:hypothetical protein
MRRCLLLLTLVSLVALCAGPAWCEAPKADELVLKIHEFVTKQMDISLFGRTEQERKDQIAAVKKQYAGDLKKLQDAAAKGTGKAKEVQQALTKFEANIDQCSKCQHSYRNLLIDLVAYEECKKKSCVPAQDAWEEIAKLARPAKKTK